MSRNPQGEFIWYELTTGDPDGGRQFYEQVIGWNIVPPSAGSGPLHWTVNAPDGPVAAIMNLDDELQPAGATPAWLGASLRDGTQPARWRPYFRVPSISTAARKIMESGGTVLRGPHEVPGGDYVILGQDPQGAQFAIAVPH